ncbi:hypothetical protein K1719_044714 [Acacia pycnantha]|nr:hypothetical protein K1719_044714 [Acacia pycnantha]
MDGSCNIVTNVKFIFLWLLAFLTVDIIIYKASSRILSVPSERDAILKLKLHLLDPSSRLTSWSADDGDCCNWASVVCNNLTGSILELHLATSPPSPPWYYDVREYLERSRLEGKIHPPLLDLKHLNYLSGIMILAACQFLAYLAQ